MINLVVDVGNTHTKLAAFKEDELLHTERFESLSNQQLNDWMNNYKATGIIVSSVKIQSEDWQEGLEKHLPVIWFNRRMGKGIQNHYRSETLGLDRWAAVIGACNLYPGMHKLVIDGGTCITYDWVDAENNYYGGSISPGLNMRFKALQHYTSALPLLEADAALTADFGDDTASAIRTGIQNGLRYELEGFITAFSKKQPGKLAVILSGGDSVFFDTLLKNSIFAGYIIHEPYLVLKGLNAAIQEHND